MENISTLIFFDIPNAFGKFFSYSVNFFSKNIFFGFFILLILSVLLIWLFRKEKFDKTKDTKLIYFARHGETILNAKKIRQGSEGGLSENGKKQAEILGQRISSVPFDVVITSPFERTQETTKIVTKEMGWQKGVEINDLLAERRNPKEIVGKSYNDLEVIDIINLIDKSYHDDDLRYSDEENFVDLKERAKKLLEFIEKRSEKKLLMVTHGIFLKMVIAYILNGDKLTAREYVKLSFFNNSDNAGITICQYDPKDENTVVKGWRVKVWNDYVKDVVPTMHI